MRNVREMIIYESDFILRNCIDREREITGVDRGGRKTTGVEK